ncbi:uncharacterized protein [Dermacentor albipictus]|uniref:uncharacterized protein n=1 Tax=Dermacentor albipictus TaxID=60249 RepID=UPI0038FC685B
MAFCLWFRRSCGCVWCYLNPRIVLFITSDTCAKPGRCSNYAVGPIAPALSVPRQQSCQRKRMSANLRHHCDVASNPKDKFLVKSMRKLPKEVRPRATATKDQLKMEALKAALLLSMVGDDALDVFTTSSSCRMKTRTTSVPWNFHHFVNIHCTAKGHHAYSRAKFQVSEDDCKAQKTAGEDPQHKSNWLSEQLVLSTARMSSRTAGVKASASDST